MAEAPLRLGLHDFLNAQPLLISLTRQADSLGLRLVLDTPAGLADRLRAGELDAAMIPSIEYLKDAPALRLLPGVCIASRGPVDSVRLAAKEPLHAVRTLAVDRRSKTSAALLTLLFSKRLSKGVVFKPMDPDPDRMLGECDAALVIGDPALALPTDQPGLTLYDLSEEWFQRTGKPFVHAVLAVRRRVHLKPETLAGLQAAKAEGLKRLDEIAASPGIRSLGLPAAAVREYLTQKIRYGLGAEELDGLTHFRDLCLQNGLLHHAHPLEFV